MKPHDNTDPWSQGQKQVHYSAPGWLSKLTLIVTVPFRLVFGVIGFCLSILGAFAKAFSDNDNYESIGTGLRDLHKDYEFNWDGTNNMDGDPMSTDEHKK